MTNQPNPFTFRDVAPIGKWDANATFQITGKQFEFLYNFSQMLQSFPFMAQDMYRKAIESGVIKTEYQYPDGSPATEEHIKQFETAMESVQRQIKGDQPEKSGLVDNNGAPIV